MHIPLLAWGERNFDPPPCLPTLVKTGKSGAIIPPPFKVRGWMVDENGNLNEFGRLMQEILDRPRNATGLTLVQDQNGQRIPYNTFTDRFDKARTAAGYAPMQYQFRDIRAKVATDSDTIEEAQDRLGHTHRSTTERHYVRRGKLVEPAK